MDDTPQSSALDRKHRLVTFASSLGTAFEWCDFYIFGTLAVFFGKRFFPPGNETAAFRSSLALFGIGFVVGLILLPETKDRDLTAGPES